MSIQAGAATVRTVVVLLLATWPRRVVLGLLLLAPVVVLVLGGWARAEPRSFELQPGERVDLGPYTVRADSYFVSDRVLPLLLDSDDPDDAHLGVLLEIENTGSAALSPTSAANVFVPQVDEGLVEALGSPSGAVLVSDGSLGSRIMPGLPTQVALLWKVPDGAALAQEELRLELTESRFEYSLMGDEDRWFPFGDVWGVTLPRVEPPASIVEEEPSW